jgi:PKD repeat protein
MERRITRFLLPFLFLLIGVVFSVQAQISRPGTPVSIEKNAPDVTMSETFNPAVDWNVIMQEDAFYKQQGGYAPRGGLSVPVGRRITEFGEWMLSPEGDVIWRVQLHSQDAKALGVVFSDFYLPPNTELYVYDVDRQIVAGAFTSENNHSSMQFSTRLIPSSTIIIEYIERGSSYEIIEKMYPEDQFIIENRNECIPISNYTPQTNFRIDELIYMYIDVYSAFDASRPQTGASQACQVNIRCSPVGDPYLNQKRGVAHIVFREGAGWYLCSGTLVNNTLQNGVPYFLTAYHCGGVASAADHNVWQFYFNYERPTCDNTGSPPTTDMITGCTYRAGYPILNGSDFQLVELNSNVPLAYNPFYNGWDRSTVGATSGASIHHPAGDVKKISTFTAQLISSTPTIDGQAMATNSAWRVVWSSNPNGWGVTEGGSSGSPIFNQNGRQVGTLTGGSSTCASPTSADFYGKFDYHWISNGGTADVQLRPWLDPVGTNPTFLDGWDPTWVSAPPVTDFSGTPTTIMAGQTVQFTDLSTNGPNQWSWTITGAYPPTSTERNPAFTFITPGQYTVSLTSTNGYGSDTETKVNYITVTPYSGSASPITIGTGTNSGTYWPFGISTQGTAGYRYVADVSIYTQAELGNAGVITQLEWRPGTSRTDSRNMKIYLKHTTLSTLSTNTIASYTTGATLVYNGPFIPNVAGWFAFVLQTPFSYNGTQNLMVITEVNTAGAPGNVASNCYYTASANRHQQWAGAAAPTGNGTVNGNRPNIRITKNPLTAPVADFVANAQIDVYDEGFDGTWLPTGWTVQNFHATNRWQQGNPSANPFSNIDPSSTASAIVPWIAQNQNEWIISPAINTAAYAGQPLRIGFYAGFSRSWLNPGATMSFKISTNGGSTWTELWNAIGDVTEPAGVQWDWRYIERDLSAYAGQNLTFAWQYVGNDGDLMGLDGISIFVSDPNPTHISIFEGETVSFIDQSTNNPSVWNWQLPGGIPGTTYEQNPTIQYDVAGWYNVALTAANGAGSDTETKTNYVEVLGRAPLANFGATGNLKTINFQPFIPSGADVVFTDMSTRVPTGWNWTFENGNPATSSNQNPTVNYTAVGEHDVQLIATNAHGNDTLAIDSLVAVMGTFFVTNMLPSDGLTVYTLATEPGYLPGHNGYLMNKYAEFFTNSYEGEITAVLFGVYEALGTGKNINVTIWESNNGAPGAILHTQTEAITNFTALQYNVITLTAPVTVTGDFFVGYELNYDATHNYTTHMFCPMMAPARTGANPLNSAWVMDQSVWYTIDDAFGGLPTSLSVEPEFTYASTGPIATVTATPGCGTGTVRVTSSENTNQTFHLTDDVGTILSSWTGSAQFYDFTGRADGTYRGQVVIGAQTSPLSAAVVLTNDPTTVGGAVSGINPQLCLGSNTGTLTLSGHTGTVLRWQKRINAGAWTDIANTATTYSEVPASAGTWEYRAEVQSGSCPAAFSSAYSILVHPATVAGAVSGVSPTICLGQSTGTLTLSGYTGTINKWQVRYNAGAWIDIAHTGATYSATPGAAGTYEYRAEVQSGTCAAAFSTAYTITVSPVSVGGTVTGTNTQICLGSATGTMTLAGHTGTIVRWERRFNAGAWQNIANTTTTHSETPGAAGVYEYRAVIQSGTCAEANSAIHAITVHPVSVGGTVSGATTQICLGQATGTMTLAGHTGTIVRWQRRVNAGGWVNIANTNTTYSETPASAGVWEYRAEIQSGNCASTFSTAHSITVHPTTVGGTVSSATTQICLGSATGTMTLSGHTGTIVRWERRFNAGAWQNIANTTTTHSETPGAAGTYEYRAVLQSGTCATANSAIHTITVHPTTVGGTVSSATTQICLGSATGTMTLSGHTGTIVRWERRFNAGAWQNIANTTTTHSETPGAAGTYEYRAVLQSGTCATANSSIHTITVHPTTVGGTVSSATTQICLGSATGTMTLSGHTGTIVRWERRFNAGAWQNIANTTTTHSETPGAAGTYEYRAVLQSGTCATANSAIHTITVYPVSVGGSVTGAATQICLGENTGTLTLAGHTGTVVRWQKRVDGGVWTNITNTLTTYSEIPSSIGVWDYRAEVQSGNCTSTYSSIKTITVNPGSVGGNVTGTNTEICLGVETGTMTLTGHTGTVIKWQKRVNAGVWADIVNTALTYNETPATAGAWEYRAVVQSGTCTEAYSTAHAITVHPVSVGGSVSGINTELCFGSNTGTLTLSGYTGSIVRWQKRVDGGVWTNITNTAATYSEIPSSAGVWEYRAEVKSGSCNSVFSAAYSITVYPATVAGSVTGTITEACLGAGTGTLTLSGYVGTIVKWQRQVDGGGWTDIVNAAATYSETPATAGVYEYRAVVKSGVCSEGFSTAHTITFYPVTVGGSVAGINPEICLGANTGTLTLSGHTGSVVRWQKRLNAGAWTNIANTGTTYSEVPSSAGVWEYRAEIKSGACNTEYSSAYSITVYPATVAGTVTGTITEACLGAGTGTLTLSGYVGAIVKWQRQVDGGGWTDIANTAATYSETPATAGVYEYRAVVKSGVCAEEFSVAHTITVYPATVAGTVTGTITEACLGSGTGTLTLSGYVGAIVKWQRQVDGGGWTDIANTAATYSETPATAGVYEYRAVVKSGVCAEEFSVAHTITVYPASVAGTVSGTITEACLGSGTGTLTLSGYVGSIVKWQRQVDGGGWTDIANTAATYSEIPAIAGVYEYRAVVKSGVCSEEFSVAHNITIYPVTVGGSVSGVNPEICLGANTGTLTLTGHTGSVVRWQRRLNAGIWVNITNTATTYSEVPSSAGVWEYRAEIKSGTCNTEYSTAYSITVHPASVGGAVTGTITEACLGSGTGTLTLSGYVGSIVKWQRSVDGGVWTDIANTAATYSETPVTAGVYAYRAVLQSGTCAQVFSTAHSITFYPVSVGGTVTGTLTEICLGSNTGLMTLTGYTGTIVRWQKRVDGGAWNNIANTNNVFGEIPTSAGVWEYRAEVQSGICSSVYSSAWSITVYPGTVAGTLSIPQTHYCIGSPTSIMTLSGYTGSIVKWQKRLDGGAWTDIAHTGDTYSETPASAGVWDYQVVVQSGTCAQATSNMVSLTVAPASVGGTTSTGVTQIFIGQTTDNITLSGQVGSVIKWQKRLDGGAWIDIAFTGTVYSEIPNSVGFWDYRAVIQSGVCSEAYSSFVTVEVLPSEAGGVTGGNSPICLGDNTGIMTLTGYSGSILRWEKRVDAGAWVSIANTTDTYSEIPSSAGTWEYRAVVFTTVELFSAPATIIVNPATAGGSVAGNSDICLGSSTGTLTLSGHTGSVLKWQVQFNGGGWSDIANTTTTYSEIPAVAGNYEYRAQVQSGVCPSAFSVAQLVVVHPVTVGGSVSGPNSEICVGSSTGTLTLTGYTGTIVRWERSDDFGATWMNLGNIAPTYSEIPGVPGVRMYRAVVQSGNCSEENSSSHTIAIYPLSVGGSVSGPNTQICLGASTGTMTLSGYTGAILKWQVSYNAGPWTDIANTNVTYSTTPGLAGTYTYRAVVQSGVCGSANSSEFTITVDPIVAGGTLDNNGSTICLGSPIPTLTLTGYTGTIVKWQKSDDGTTWTDIANTNATYSETPATSGDWYYRVEVSSGTCGSAYSTISVIHVDPVSVGGSVNGPNTQICLGSSTGTMTLSGHTGSITKWQVSYNAGAWTDIANTNATYSTVPVSAGTYAYRAAVQSGSCSEVYSSTFTITVDPVTVGGSVNGPNTQICIGSSTGTMTLSGHTGSIIKWQVSYNAGAWTDIANTTSTYSTTPVTAGTYAYRAVVQSGSCSVVNSASFTITVNPLSVGGTVNGPNTQICLGASTGTMTLSGYTGIIQKWQVSYNAGAWTDITNTNATYSTTPALAGTYSYRAVVQSGVCGTANSAVFTITVDPLVAGGTLDNNGMSICLGSPIPTLTLSGYSGTIVKWQKSDDGATWADIANTNATYSETPVVAGDWYYRVEVSSGTCGSAYSTVSVIHVDPVSVGGSVNGPNTQICLGSSTGTMTLSGYTGTIQKWQVSYNAGPWTDITNTNATYSTTPALAGTYAYRAVVQSGVCGSANSAVFTITVDPISVGGSVNGTTTEICLGASTGTLTLTGYTGNILNWQRSVDGGAWTDFANTNATYSETPATAGSYAYRAVVQSGVCGVAYSTSFTITVDPLVVGGSVNGTLTETCLGSSVGTLTLSGHTGTVVKWQKQLNAGAWTDISNTGTTYSETPVIAGVWNYRAVIESGACGQTNSAAFAVTVHPSTVAGNVTGVETEICLGSSTGTMTLGGYTGAILKWQRSIDGGAWADIAHSGATYSETPLLAGVYVYRAQVQSGTCSALFSTSHTITVYPVTVAGSVTPLLTTIFLGEQTGTLTLSGHTGSVVKWQKRHDGGAWVDIVNTAATYIETPALVGTWEYRAVVESGVCGQEFSAVATVIVQASAAGSVSGGNSPICLGSSTGIMTLSGYTGTILRWQKSLDGGAWTDISHTLDTYSEIPSSSGTWQYRAVVFTTTELFSNPVTIEVDPVSVPGTLAGGGVICLGSVTPLMTLAGHTGDIQNWEYRYNGGAWTNIAHTGTTYSEIPALTGLYEYRVLVQSGVCGSEYSNTVSVTVDPAVAGGTLDNNGQTICFGSQTPLYTLTGYSGTIVKWQKSDDGVNWTDIVNTGNTYQEIPSSAGNWYYRAVVESGACGSANSTVSSVTVDPATFVGTLSGVNTEICLGNPTGNMTLSGYTGTVVKWQYNIDGGAWNDIAQTAAVYNETPLTAGLYGYRVEVQSGVCAAEYSDVHYINVFPLVVAGAVNSDATICEGSSTGVLTLTGYTGTVVKWQKSDDGVNWTDISNTTDTYSEVPATTGTWYYRAEVQSGVCGSEFSTAAVITVDPATVTGTLTALTTEICEGSATGTMTLSGYTGSVIHWIARVDGGAWTDIAVTTDTYDDTPSSTGVWEYAVVVQSGVCDADTSNLVMITVIEGTVAGTLTAPNTEICESTSTGTMIVTGYTGSILKWQKRLNMGTWIDIANTSDTHSEVLITPGSWAFRAEVQNGGCDVLYTNTITIQVSSATVSGSIEGNEAEICLGEPTGLMVINGFTGSIQMWQRRVDGGAWEDLAVTVSTYEDTPILSGNWEYRALVQSGSCAQEYTDTAMVTVYDMPVAGYTYVVDDYTVTFTNTSTGATSYYWTFGDGTNSTDVNPVHTYATSGSKVVTLTAYNGVCEDQYQITVSITVSIIELGNNAFIGIYPNPTDNGRFNISFMTDGSNEYEISVYDVTGRIIYSEIVKNITNGTVHPVTLTDAAPGAYRIKLTSEDGSFEKVLIIQ